MVDEMPRLGLSDDALPDRVPCTDEMCTGVLDDAGVCGTCGRGATPGAVARAPREDVDDHDDEHTDDEHTDDEHPADDAIEPAGDGDAAVERVPCADPMCTGIVGADGACGTCGRRA